MRGAPRWLSATHLDRSSRMLAVLLAAALGLEFAAGIGLACVCGLDRVKAVLDGYNPVWLLSLTAALAVSFTGYFYAYRGIFSVEGGPWLSGPRLRAVAAAGFSGFLGVGGGALDEYALRAAGAGRNEAKIRTTALAGLEHGVLSIGGCATAIVVLVTGSSVPSPSLTLPWALIPVPGFLVAFWVAERYRARLHHLDGWRGALGRFLDSVHIIRELCIHPLRWGPAVAGMAVFWAADAAAVWAGLAAAGLRMNAAALFIGYATGLVFTRRTAPLAGAGVLTLVLPLTIWASGAPLPMAIVGVFTYRLLVLLLPLPVSFAVLPTLRGMGRHLASEVSAAAPHPPGLRTPRA
jgi:hypothetical protein